jgi:hypothetical protein
MGIPINVKNNDRLAKVALVPLVIVLITVTALVEAEKNPISF